MKNRIKLMTLCLGLVAIQTTHPFSVSDTWNQAKNTAKSGYESAKFKAQTSYQDAKQGWENLDESTKNAILGVGIATAGTAAAAGAGYAGYKAYEGQSSSVGPSEADIFNRPSRTNPQKTTYEELKAFGAEGGPKSTIPQQDTWYSQRPITEIIAHED